MNLKEILITILGLVLILINTGHLYDSNDMLEYDPTTDINKGILPLPEPNNFSYDYYYSDFLNSDEEYIKFEVYIICDEYDNTHLRDLSKKIPSINKDNLNNSPLNLPSKNPFNLHIVNMHELQGYLNISKVDQLSKIEDLIEKYNEQTIKFKNINENILNGTEQFYPKEAKLLFNDYIKLLPELLDNLEKMKETVNSSIILSNFQESELDRVSIDVFNDEINPENIALPYQDEEEIYILSGNDNSYYNKELPEDIFNDGKGMFDENDSSFEYSSSSENNSFNEDDTFFEDIFRDSKWIFNEEDS